MFVVSSLNKIMRQELISRLDSRTLRPVNVFSNYKELGLAILEILNVE